MSSCIWQKPQAEIQLRQKPDADKRRCLPVGRQVTRINADLPVEEKRKFVRIDLCIEISYEILPMLAGKAQSNNLSGGGLCFMAKEALEKNTVLLLKFNLPDSENTSIECTGRVIWQEAGDTGYLTGIEFLSEDYFFKQLKIQKFISDYCKDMEQYYPEEG